MMVPLPARDRKDGILALLVVKRGGLGLSFSEEELELLEVETYTQPRLWTCQP